MPVIPSFRGFAQTPNLYQAAAAGAGTALNEAQHLLAIRTQADRVALERQQLQQRAQESEIESQIAQMRVAAQQRMAQDEALKRATELSAQSAYQNAQIGLKNRELDMEQSKIQAQAAQFARTIQASQLRSSQAVHGSAAGGYFTMDPTGKAVEVRPPVVKAAEKPRSMTRGDITDFYSNSTAMQELERQALSAEERGASPEELLREFSLLGRTPPYSSLWAARMRPRVDRGPSEPRASLNPETGRLTYSGSASQIEGLRDSLVPTFPEPGTTNAPAGIRNIRRVR